MPIFQLRRGTSFEARRRSEASQGFVLKILCFTLTWKYPIPSVWLESKFAFSPFGDSGPHYVWWREKFMPVVPESATGDITQWPEEKVKALREDAQRQTDALKESGGEPSLSSPFFGAYTKWKSDGFPDCTWNNDALRRASDELEKRRNRHAD